MEEDKICLRVTNKDLIVDVFGDDKGVEVKGESVCASKKKWINILEQYVGMAELSVHDLDMRGLKSDVTNIKDIAERLDKSADLDKLAGEEF